MRRALSGAASGGLTMQRRERGVGRCAGLCGRVVYLCGAGRNYPGRVRGAAGQGAQVYLHVGRRLGDAIAMNEPCVLCTHSCAETKSIET